ncbi:hypothetical protein K435DRAFT_805085 [Dendrothele bispora CBS 962.96]|uniref:Uncharacterized protein n=1 Tax=Dendrothele bispora (strain CBS 962.96) TaxID=1314807 RepID=A0A4S8LC34_DENBC|nr:hypothetical protein K435DRAFT_805085 [Dendrothele bispora CBS 962.96]
MSNREEMEVDDEGGPPSRMHILKEELVGEVTARSESRIGTGAVGSGGLKSSGSRGRVSGQAAVTSRVLAVYLSEHIRTTLNFPGTSTHLHWNYQGRSGALEWDDTKLKGGGGRCQGTVQGYKQAGKVEVGILVQVWAGVLEIVPVSAMRRVPARPSKEVIGTARGDGTTSQLSVRRVPAQHSVRREVQVKAGSTSMGIHQIASNPPTVQGWYTSTGGTNIGLGGTTGVGVGQVNDGTTHTGQGGSGKDTSTGQSSGRRSPVASGSAMGQGHGHVIVDNDDGPAKSKKRKRVL